MVIRDIMTRTVVTAATHTSVREVAEIMRERNVGGVVLCAEDGAPVAFITDRDVAVSVVAAGRDALAAAGEHASSPVVTGEPDMDLREAATLMARFGIRRLPVLEDGRLAGIVTLDDIAVRTADPELQSHLTATITRSALPEFYFHQRGG
ncbi:MAG TPA: CBS domain-containing protein [Solirubrobacteraceae bacterium]|nr:CBS domain-containing protein [Solirubrobacteraceae bacterium]